MVLDVLTTIQYYDYGVDPNSLQCNLTRNDLSMEQNTLTSTTEPSSTSPDFSYFTWACVIWALTPIVNIFNLIQGMFNVDVPTGSLDMWLWIIGKIKKINRQQVVEKDCVWKAILILLSLPIIILFSVLHAYVINPIVILANGVAILCPRIDDIPWIKWCKRQIKVTKLQEAIFEAIGQCIIAMNFYSADKEYFDCPEPFFPWIDKGTVVLISMVFSVGSIILSCINFGNEMFTLSYGKDWWKSLLGKRSNVSRVVVPGVLFFTFVIMIFIGSLIYIIC